MHVAYFTERPYRWVPEDDVIRNKAFFALPNSLFDHVRGAEDYNYDLDEYVYAEELGFDGVALNEHHGNPFCMGNVMNVEAAILARITQRVKIILIGNPLPVIKHPLRMAEELATIDLISRGRLVAGWVRGAGSEQFFNNANPAYNREMFEEAYEFIQMAWTKPGPWRYEGKHFHYRHVNPWALPYQKPVPPTMIPGVLSPETVRWAAAKSLPYIGLGTSLGPTADLWDIYADVAAENGYQAGPENFGYLIPTFVADTDEKAQELGKGFIYGGGQTVFSRPEHTLPPGYNSKDAIRRLSKQPGGSWLGVNRNKLMQAATDDDAPSTTRRCGPGPRASCARASELPHVARFARHDHREGQDDDQRAAARHVRLLRPAGPGAQRGPPAQPRAARQVRDAGDQGLRRIDRPHQPLRGKAGREQAAHRGSARHRGRSRRPAPDGGLRPRHHT
ncbi:MAG: LLM class flavin-dependent oxidoreductase [Acidimicrobiales bacterium]